MRIELKPRKKSPEPQPATSTGPDVEMSAEEKAALELEKQQLLASLGARVPRQSPQSPAVKDGLDKPEPPAEIAPVEESSNAAYDVSLKETASAVSDAVAQRKALEADIRELEQQLAAAKVKERQAQQAAIAAQQRVTQAEGAASLAQFKPKLAHHLAEVSRIQGLYGSPLREAARSLASGFDVQQRERKAEAYRAAQPLGARLGDARATIESAAKGVEQAMQSSHVHVHEQAAVLANAALEVNLLALETECASLVQLIRELNPDFRVGYIAPDRMPPVREPLARPSTADLGRSILA